MIAKFFAGPIIVSQALCLVTRSSPTRSHYSNEGNKALRMEVDLGSPGARCIDSVFQQKKALEIYVKPSVPMSPLPSSLLPFLRVFPVQSRLLSCSCPFCCWHAKPLLGASSSLSLSLLNADGAAKDPRHPGSG